MISLNYDESNDSEIFVNELNFSDLCHVLVFYMTRIFYRFNVIFTYIYIYTHAIANNPF